jgi:predicted phosphodiesterase
VRYLVLSDIHSNIDALDAVLDDARDLGTNGVLVLGDLVGYGAEPELVVERVRALAPLAIVRGNHDKVVAGVATDDGFNPLAKHSVDLTRRALSRASLDYLAALPEGPCAVDPVVEICHGSPFDEDWYLHQEMDVLEALGASQRPVCLFGHTHVPFAASAVADGELEILFAGDGDGREISLVGGRRYVINPGSVGQPRDGDPRAAYGVVDTEAMTVAVRRVAYPVERARDRIFAAGFPRPLGQRLMVGR